MHYSSASCPDRHSVSSAAAVECQSGYFCLTVLHYFVSRSPEITQLLSGESLTHSLIHSLPHSLSLSLPHSLPPPLPPSLTHSQSVTHSVTHLLTHLHTHTP